MVSNLYQKSNFLYYAQLRICKTTSRLQHNFVCNKTTILAKIHWDTCVQKNMIVTIHKIAHINVTPLSPCPMLPEKN